MNWIWGGEATGICVLPALANANLAGCSRGLRSDISPTQSAGAVSRSHKLLGEVIHPTAPAGAEGEN
ncbi:MAG: hypothetical protein OEX16_01430 [Hadesarchaea archaeon]|nr:hypothetical protein [Hadesarchaea archaeon]MDH5685114.1 hypothetical protein [Hadesarchaea archaeon]